MRFSHELINSIIRGKRTDKRLSRLPLCLYNAFLNIEITFHNLYIPITQINELFYFFINFYNYFNKNKNI